MKLTATQRDIVFAREFAKAEKYHLMSFSDGANSAEHLIRVVDLENSERELNIKFSETIPVTCTEPPVTVSLEYPYLDRPSKDSAMGFLPII